MASNVGLGGGLTITGGAAPPVGTRQQYIVGQDTTPRLWSSQEIYAAALAQDRARSVPMLHDSTYAGYGNSAGYTRHAISNVDGRMYRATVPIVSGSTDPSGDTQWERTSITGLGPDPAWFSYNSMADVNTWYARVLPQQVPVSVSFEFECPDLTVVPVTVANVALGTQSGFWGGLLTVQSHVVGAKTYQSRVCLRPGNLITVHAGENINGLLSDFRFRKVRINGTAVDTMPVVVEGITYSTTEMKTNDVWVDGKTIFRRTFTGTTPDNAFDNKIFDVTGATKITRVESLFQQKWYDRLVTNWANGAAHGQGFQLYKINGVWEGHSYNSAGDGRFQGMPYDITVYYTK